MYLAKYDKRNFLRVSCGANSTLYFTLSPTFLVGERVRERGLKKPPLPDPPLQKNTGGEGI